MLWAARRALKLLHPDSELELLRLEGLTPADASEDDDHFLGCDLSEYYGGTTLTTASRLVLTQLKYSVKHPNRVWSAARLTAKAGRGSASPLRRLADMFTGLVGDSDSQTVVNKVHIALVSNQPASADLLTALTSAKDALATRPLGTHAGRAFAQLSARQRQVLAKLREASGLANGQFTDFVRVLDLSDCGSDSRALQVLSLQREASDVLVGPIRPGVIGLIELMRRQMLPETADDPGLGRSDIIVALGASGEPSLFPYPTLARKPKRPIKTGQPGALAAALQEAQTGMVLGHGGLGIGKTTALTTLGDELPPGSVVVVYDCYADGQYLDPANDRHSERAVIQIANEIAVRGGALPVVVPDGPVVHTELWRGLERTMAAVAGDLPEGALLTIAIDAADNAVYAANQVGTAAFVRGLWHVRLPPNVRLLMTARSARREDVLVGVEQREITQVELQAFDASASAAMLRTVFPEALDRECAAFHEASKGVARVQAYALGVGELPRTDESTGPNDSTIEGVTELASAGLAAIFDEVLATALSTVQDRATREKHIAVLATMARPARPSTLARVLDVTESRVRQLCGDLFPAIRISADAIGFADEDFEHHLRDQLSDHDVRQAHDLFAQHFLAQRDVEEEAARLVGQHLFNAGRYEDLLELALEDGAPEAITDGMARAQAHRARLMLALRAVARRGEENPSGESVRLLIAAGDAARTDSSLVDTVRQRPELAVLHADAATVAEIVVREEASTWRGRAHLRAAALLSWSDGRTSEASEQLDLALAWLRAWSQEDDRHGGDFGPEDIAYGVHAAYFVSGLERAYRLAAGWRPATFVDAVTSYVAQFAPGQLPINQIVQDLDRIRAGAWVRAQFAVAYARTGQRLPKRWVQRIAVRLDRMPRRPVIYSAEWGVAFCEVALGHGVAKSRVRRLLKRFAPPVPSHVGQYTGSRKMLLPLRAASLDAALRGQTLASEDLLPEGLRPSVDRPAGSYDKYESERRTFLDIVGSILPVMTARADCLSAAARRTTGTDVVDEPAAAAVDVVRSTLDGFGKETTQRFYRAGDRQRSWFVAAVEALTSAAQAVVGETKGRDEAANAATSPTQTMVEGALADVGDSIGRLLGDGAAYAWVQMSQTLLESGVCQNVALQLLQRAGDAMEDAAVPASDRRDVLLDAAAAAQLVDADLAGDLFAAAVRAASGVDADIALRLRALLAIADGIADDPACDVSIEDRARVARMLAYAVEDAAPRVPDPQEHLPHRLTLAVATRLHGPTGLALACRWEDEEHTDLSEGIRTIAPLLARNGSIDAVDAFWMLRLLDQDTDPVAPAISVLETLLSHGAARRSEAVACLDTLADWVIRDLALRLQADSASRLVEAAQGWGLGQLECVQRLLARARALTALFQYAQDQRTSRIWEVPIKERPADLATVIAGANFASAEQDLHALAEAYVPDEQVVAYLTNATRHAGPAGRAHALETLLQLADRGLRRVRATHVATAVAQMCHEWRATTSVRNWARTRLPDWVAQHLLDLFATGMDRHGTYPTMLLQRPSSGPVRSHWLLPAAASHLDELSAAQLYTLATTLAETMRSASALTQVVDWALNAPPPARGQVATAHASRGGSTDGPPIDGSAESGARPTLPVEPSSLLAVALWALLGHPDRRVRWRAIHSVRLLLTRGRDGRALAAALWRCKQADATGGDCSRGFRSATLDFFPQSASHWLLIAFARIADDFPAVLAPMAEELAATARDGQRPHAAVRELARQAALDVASADSKALPPNVVDDLAFANRPIACSTSDAPSHVGSRFDDYGSRFRFDPLDVVPYWYEPLAWVFDGVDLADVMTRADAWIIDRWGRSSDEAWQDPRVLRYERSWRLVSADHGSLPIVETLQKYLEYHALQMVAGELVDAGTPVRKHWAEKSDAWEGWLTEHLPQSQTHWLADAREPVPTRALTVGAWGLLQASDVAESEQASESGTTSDLTAQLGTPQQRAFDGAAVARHACRSLEKLDDDPNMMVISASTTTRAHYYTCTAWLTTALVTPGASKALLAALASSTRPQILPVSGDGPPWGDEIDEPEIKLLGWLTDNASYHEGLDHDDPLTGGIPGPGRVPFKDFLSWARLSNDATGTRFVDAEGRLGAHVTCWGDENRRGSRDSEQEYTGSYLGVRRDLLMAYLDQRSLSLVSAADAHVYRSGAGATREDRDDNRSARYVVQHANGRVDNVEVEQGL